MRRRLFLAIHLTGLFLLAHLALAGPRSRAVEATFVATVENVPAGAKQLEAWIPLPADTPNQNVTALTVDSPYPVEVRHDSDFGNAYLYIRAPHPSPGTLVVRVHFRAVRREIVNTALTPDSSFDPEPAVFSRYLKADRLVTLSPRVRKIAETVTRGAADNAAKARAIYQYVMTTVKYDKTVPGWGHGDTERVCDVHAGNCTDFHSLFISLARASGVPARFVIGFPLPEAPEGKVPGYHCWAEFYIAGYGWVPADPSEASKSSDAARRAYLFGNLDPDRLAFTTGRDIRLSPPQHGDPLNYFMYPYAEADGRLLAQTKIELDYRNLPRPDVVARAR
jgi:transglutaminase-like putative cysteine protease